MARQPKAVAAYQRRRAKVVLRVNDRIRDAVEAARAAYEDRIGQKVSLAVLLHRMSLLMLDHMPNASSIEERDLLMELAARGEVVERAPADVPA